MNWNGLTIPDNPYFYDEDVVIYHGDCREILPLIPDKSIDLVLTDIPYNISQRDNGLRSLSYGDWDSGFQLDTLYRALDLHPANVYVWCGDEQLSFILEELSYRKYLTRTLVWCKQNPTVINGDKMWLPSTRLCAWGKLPKALYLGHCQLGYFIDSPDSGRLHPNQKPILITQHFIATSSRVGQTILDPFLGSGTTAYCAKKLNRKCIGVEIEERYCEIAAKRCMQSVMRLNL